MVDAKHLLFAEEFQHRLIDRTVAGQVMAQRLFEHEAGRWCIQTCCAQLRGHIGEQMRRNGQIHHRGVCGVRIESRFKPSIAVLLAQIHALVMQHRGKAVKLLLAGPLGQLHLVKTRANQLAVFLVAHLIARHADDAATFRQCAMAKRLKQRGHEFAPGQIACATEEDEIEAHEKTCLSCKMIP